MKKENGAILADEVGLGKTWSALSVMKYFEIKGYKVILLCPKKLENNWRQYLEGHRLIFENDRLKFTVRTWVSRGTVWHYPPAAQFSVNKTFSLQSNTPHLVFN